MIDKEEFEKYSVKEKLGFINKVLSLVTHNAFSKDDLLFLIKWQNDVIEKMKNCANCPNWIMNISIQCCDICKNKDVLPIINGS